MSLLVRSRRLHASSVSAIVIDPAASAATSDMATSTSLANVVAWATLL